ncbi:MAG: T9SS type A sorting domain-containing protein [Bacteroidales bacterium]|nr:T9SS type A sorting domain-containing protein [Bacteroidales bacterium]
MDFTVDAPGAYVLRYDWFDEGTYAVSTFNFFSYPTISLVADENICFPDSAYVEFDLSWASHAPKSWDVNWTLNGNPFSGPDTTGTFYVDARPTCGQYILEVTVDNKSGGSQDTLVCSSDPVADTMNFYDEATIYAGSNDTVCGLEYELQGTWDFSCGTPTTAWTKVSGPGGVSFVYDSVFVDTCGTYEFRYSVSNDPDGFCEKADTVAITFRSSPVVDAGDDDSVCGLEYLLMPSYTDGCGNPTTAWTQVAGQGMATFSEDSVFVNECGYYEFEYAVYNYPCDTVKDTVAIYFYDTPSVYADAGGADTIDVCGLAYEMDPVYYIDCDSSYSPTTAWSQDAGPGTLTFVPGTDSVYASDCGYYTLRYTVTNQLCTAYDTVVVGFHERPNPEIVGDTMTFACAEDLYVVLDNRTCTNITEDITYSWYTDGSGTIVSGQNTDSVRIEWNDQYGTGWIIVWASIENLPDCGWEDSLMVVRQQPTLAGQVKYWNEWETYMPTPFTTDINGTTPPDYFYVTLYENTTDMFVIGDAYQRVEPNLDPDNELFAHWEYDLPVARYGCDAEFFLEIWDGGYLFDPGYPTNAMNKYLGGNYTYNNFGGVNATDAYMVNRMVAGIDINAGPYNVSWVGPQALTPEYGYYSFEYGDVNTSGGITAVDALQVNYRSVGHIPFYYHSGTPLYNRNFEVTGRMVDKLPDTTWSQYFDDVSRPTLDVPFDHSGEDYQYYDSAVHHKYTSELIPWTGAHNYMNIYYEALGDINASYVPQDGGFKSYDGNEMVYEGEIAATTDDEVIIPIRISQEASVNAITLNMTYDNTVIEVLGVNYGEDYFNINQEEGILRIAWFGNESKVFKAEDVIAQVKVRVLADVEKGKRLFALEQGTELADAAAKPIPGVTFKSMSLTSDLGDITGGELVAKNYPNPFKDNTTIEFVLPLEGKVQLKVYNELGKLVGTFIDATLESGIQTYELSNSSLKPGVYFYSITLDGAKDYSVTKSMMVIE